MDAEKRTNTENSLACRGTGELVERHKLLPSDALSDLTCRQLIREAIESLKYAYAPYSGFKTGAALLTKRRTIYTGCNIENAAFSPSLCAERTAFAKAVSAGEREFTAIAIVGGKGGALNDYCPPCGVCRQVMTEFCDPKNFYVILARSEDDYWAYTLMDLLPMSFAPAQLME